MYFEEDISGRKQGRRVRIERIISIEELEKGRSR